jgi:DNA-binding FadR family transcriptional regulator
MKRSNHILQRHNLADAVVGKLQQRLSLGEYQPGEKLPSEPELMEQFGVGRSTIREAIRILANTGLLSVRQGSGTFVESQTGITEPLSQRLKRANAADLKEVRQLLEVKMAERAAMHRTKKDIEKMQTLLKKRDEMGNAGDLDEVIRVDILFHIALAESAGNDILADLFKTIADHMCKRFREVNDNTEEFVITQHLHESVLKSVIDRDPKKARYWTEKIISQSKSGSQSKEEETQ